MGTLVFQANLGGAVNLIGPNTASTVNFTLPSADGTSGQALVTNGTGTLSFSTFTSGAAGSNTQVQYNSSGAFAGSANLTFNGTTLTAANTSVTTSETLSYGTANGVAYLNGSKVVTTGSALTFDGTTLKVGYALSGVVDNAVSSGVIAASSYLTAHQTSKGILQFQSDVTTIRSYGATTGSGQIAFNVGGGGGSADTEGMRLNSSGNLGLGVTPSAWGSPLKAFELASGSHVYANTNGIDAEIDVGSNFYYNGTSLLYKITQSAARYNQKNGVHAWSYAPSGTAGTAVTFTQAMTLDTSGNLALGSTSAAAGTRLDITIATGFEGYAGLIVRGPSTNNGYAGGIDFPSNDGTTVRNRIRNDSGGMEFYTANTERARIDSSGNFLVGTTSTIDAGHSFKKTTTNVASFYRTTSTTTDSLTSWWSDVGGTLVQKALCLASGNFQNANNSYGAISDVKLKENIVDATPKLAGLMQVKIRNYNLIGDTQKQIGVVAQELEQIFPNMVDESPDIDSDGNDLGTTTKSVKYSVFVPMLIKAIQELKTEFDAYKATHP